MRVREGDTAALCEDCEGIFEVEDTPENIGAVVSCPDCGGTDCIRWNPYAGARHKGEDFHSDI